MLRKCFATMLVALSITIIGIYSADARGRRGHRRGHVKAVLSNLDLTNEQQIAIAEGVFKLRDEGATKEEISNAILEMFEEFDVEVPEALSNTIIGIYSADVHGKRGHRRGHVKAVLSNLDLTNEQRIAIAEEVFKLRGKGATKEKISNAILEMFEEFDVEVPEALSNRSYSRLHPLLLLGDLLTDEQRMEIHDTVSELRKSKEDGVDREEFRTTIRTAVKGLLIEWGIIDGDGVDGKAVADVAIIDGQIQAAPSKSTSPKLRNTSWAAIKAER